MNRAPQSRYGFEPEHFQFEGRDYIRAEIVPPLSERHANKLRRGGHSALVSTFVGFLLGIKPLGVESYPEKTVATWDMQAINEGIVALTQGPLELGVPSTQIPPTIDTAKEVVKKIINRSIGIKN